ncbi:Prophage CP4-57 integrase [Pseudoalteromonas sp. P1-9]|uniref:tyrosine-type recombinase/integrase n=1 Tax=Pseudoalteromonas sp. P1-9 TaxID=1710354 RepID=UPI0006D637AD|nr:site-specific integrase [Pseudoalteromonas sp. P1-9]KPV94800.1 Prophage CP4-57 integrase [Pseudoalteromonas sp. P1-9]
MNVQEIKSLIRKGQVGRYQVGDNLYLRISSSKTASWTFRYKINTKRKELTIAKFGDEPLGLPLVKAKAVAASYKALVRDGIDPKIQKSRDLLSDLKTVDQLAESWLKDCRERLKYPNIPERVYRKDIAPHIGELPISEITPLDIKKIIRTIKESGRPTISNDALVYCKQLFNEAIKIDLISSNPALPFNTKDAGGKEYSRDRVLSLEEITLTFKVMRNNQDCFVRQNYLAFQLLLCLGCRKGELLAAKWSEFDFKNQVWNMPKERSKTGISITYPLHDQLIAALEELKVLSVGSEFIFPNRRKSKRFPHISMDTWNAALANLFKKECLDIAHFTIHDLRRTCRTLLAEIGTAPHVAERCLNHKLPKIMAVYDRHDYFEERKEAHQKLVQYLASCF